MGLFEDEAQAMPLGKAFKAGSKALGSLSSASDTLAGRILNGKMIKEVRHGHGDWRDIIFEDGSGQAVTKDYVNSLCRVKGTERYLESFKLEQPDEMVKQARRSLARHIEMGKPVFNKSRARDVSLNFYHSHKKRVEKLGLPEPGYVEVESQGVRFMFPEPYAKLLQRKGDLQIIKKKGAR